MIILIWAYLQWKYATKEHRLVDSILEPKFKTIVSRRVIVGLILCSIAIAISFLNTQIFIILFALISIYYLIPLKYFWLRFTKYR